MTSTSTKRYNVKGFVLETNKKPEVLVNNQHAEVSKTDQEECYSFQLELDLQKPEDAIVTSDSVFVYRVVSPTLPRTIQTAIPQINNKRETLDCPHCECNNLHQYACEYDPETIRIQYWCEFCPADLTLVLNHHKGFSFVEWQWDGTVPQVRAYPTTDKCETTNKYTYSEMLENL
jgi:hypothetical protein